MYKTAENPIRAYIGTAAAQMLAATVLEFSIRAHTEMQITVYPLHRAPIDIPSPRHRRNQPVTQFSFQRFLIPRLNNYEGRALYLDSDMLVFADIAELAAWDFEDADVLGVAQPPDSGRLPQLSVALFDCNSLAWEISDIIGQLDEGAFTYNQLMLEMPIARKIAFRIPEVWNSLEKYVPGETKLLHFTDMDTQPWLSTRNPHGGLWVETLLQAISAGAVSLDQIKHDIGRGWVRPSLLYQVEHGVPDVQSLPPEVRRLDNRFVLPHDLLRPSSGPHSRAKRLVRRLVHRMRHVLGARSV